MWGNYGRILAEYPYIKKFKNNTLEHHIKINGIEILEDKKKQKTSCFHFRPF